jgi:hypothetical protein
MARRKASPWFAAAVAAATAGCASAPAAPEPGSGATSAQGTVSYEQVFDPGAVRPVAGIGHEYLRPRLEEGFDLPSYPAAALAAGAPKTELVVRVVIGADGSVTSIRPSPLADAPSGEWATVFYDAVREAVRGWRYDPCQLRDLEDGPDTDGDGRPDYTVVVASRPVPVYLDLSFRFEIVGGAGLVVVGDGAS